MNSVSVILMLSLLSSFPRAPQCRCRPAQEVDHSHGANETIEYSSGTAKGIRGQVLSPDGVAVNEAVVEIYEYADSDHSFSGYRVANARQRRAACLTDKNGKFCFAGLPSGKYALRVGTRASEGMQET